MTRKLTEKRKLKLKEYLRILRGYDIITELTFITAGNKLDTLKV